MNQEETNLSKILAKYVNNQCSKSEKDILQSWLLESDKNHQLLEDLMNSEKLDLEISHYNSFNTNKGWDRFESRINQSKRSFTTTLFYYAAAVLVVCSCISVIFYTYNRDEVSANLVEGKVIKSAEGDILPATTGAILINSKGEQIQLSNSFAINEVGNVRMESSDSSVMYSHANTEESFYELVVPKAKVIQFTLFDGSRIWVNANSRLKIPIGSIDNTRKIQLLSGEIYLEVSKYKNQKFFVETNQGVVEVLGTKFNVLSTNNLFKTTLVEGSVLLSDGNTQKILTPNNTGVLSQDGFVVHKADLNTELAWKNNVFYFNNYTILQIADQIENWYGVHVIINKDVSKIRNTYSGEIPRDVTLSEVRKILEFISGLHVSIEGTNLNIENK